MPGWTTALRFDVDCPCPGRPHTKSSVCPSAATAWIDDELSPPNIVARIPLNGPLDEPSRYVDLHLPTEAKPDDLAGAQPELRDVRRRP